MAAIYFIPPLVFWQVYRNETATALWFIFGWVGAVFVGAYLEEK